MGESLTKFACSLPYGFMADDDAARGQHSSTMRRPSGKRKYSHTACPMISAGNRYPV